MNVSVSNRHKKTAANKPQHSFSITFFGNLVAGLFSEPKNGFYLKNLGDVPVTVLAKAFYMEEAVQTVLYPGWNVELFKEVTIVEGQNIQYGY